MSIKEKKSLGFVLLVSALAWLEVGSLVVAGERYYQSQAVSVPASGSLVLTNNAPRNISIRAFVGTLSAPSTGVIQFSRKIGTNGDARVLSSHSFSSATSLYLEGYWDGLFLSRPLGATVSILTISNTAPASITGEVEWVESE